MTKIFLLITLWTLCFTSALGKEIRLNSPNGKIELRVQNEQELTYSIFSEMNPLLMRSLIDLELNNGKRLGSDLSISSVKRNQIRTTIHSPVPEKRRVIQDRYNQLEIRFKQPYTLIFRVYDDGVSYRLLTHFPDSIVIKNEVALFNFAQASKVWYPGVQPRKDADQFHISFEEEYTLKPLDSIVSSQLMFNPVLVDAGFQNRVLITEADLIDYPGMFLTGTSGKSLSSRFAPYPLEEKMIGEEFPQFIVSKRADYIARTNGTRSLPWRVMVIAQSDKDLPSNDIVYRLASPSKLTDISWIKPGKSTEEWIIGSNLYNVPFKAGVNTATYKFYVDFAKRFGFERILLDAGWSDNKNLFKLNPEINMEEIAAYAKANGIGLSLWTLASTLDRQLEPALTQFNRWGVDFIMTDFMDRDDQKVVNFHHRIAEACARHKIMLMFHGSFKPAGFNRTWPHALTREGVLGSEYNKWSNRATPTHNVTLPFIRMVAGPMDYEPGLLYNATRETFKPIDLNVMSQGTRCHQLAMFVVYDSPMQFFSGNPSTGLQEPDFMELLGSIPTVWDETKIMDGKVGEFIVTQRKKGENYFIGAMTNWTARTFKITLDFLDEGDYQLTAAEDGINADRYASDYQLQAKKVHKGDILEIKLAPGGGYVGKIVKVNQ